MFYIINISYILLYSKRYKIYIHDIIYQHYGP